MFNFVELGLHGRLDPCTSFLENPCFEIWPFNLDLRRCFN